MRLTGMISYKVSTFHANLHYHIIGIGKIVYMLWGSGKRRKGLGVGEVLGF